VAIDQIFAHEALQQLGIPEVLAIQEGVEKIGAGNSIKCGSLGD